MNSKDYQINIFYSAEDDGYIATIPELENCFAFGLSPVIALHEVLMAKELWIKAAKAEGRYIPEPINWQILYRLAIMNEKKIYNN